MARGVLKVEFCNTTHRGVVRGAETGGFGKAGGDVAFEAEGGLASPGLAGGTGEGGRDGGFAGGAGAEKQEGGEHGGG